jgi:predicted site-specific integrase-resolvase
MARFVCEAEAAKQLGIPRSTFQHWVETGILPKPIPDLGLYKALDKACDRISGLGSAENALDAWRQRRRSEDGAR